MQQNFKRFVYMQYLLVTNLFMYIYQKKYWYNVFVIIFSV